MKRLERVVVGSAVGGLLGAAAFFAVDGLIPTPADAYGNPGIPVYHQRSNPGFPRYIQQSNPDLPGYVQDKGVMHF